MAICPKCAHGNRDAAKFCEECATPLEARIRELRLIAKHKPRYNRRSRHPEKVHWLKLTAEPWPRLSLVRKVAEDGADYLGMSKQLGSLEAGKKADLVVLNSNPLENIRSTIDTRYVMVGGRLFDVDAGMQEIGGRNAPAPRFFWQGGQGGLGGRSTTHADATGADQD